MPNFLPGLAWLFLVKICGSLYLSFLGYLFVHVVNLHAGSVCWSRGGPRRGREVDGAVGALVAAANAAARGSVDRLIGDVVVLQS